MAVNRGIVNCCLDCRCGLLRSHVLALSDDLRVGIGMQYSQLWM